jgi:drug/metabolite transporter (DMT)-like permease
MSQVSTAGPPTRQTRSAGLSVARLQVIGFVLVMLGAFASAFAASRLPANRDAADLSQLTAVVLLEAVSWVAIPIYAWLLWWGFRHTPSVGRFGLRLAVLAVVAEVPYDLATTGRAWDLASQNPVFALLVSLVVLWALDHLLKRPTRHVLGAVVVCLAGVMWLVFFNVGLRLGLMPAGVVLLLFCLVFYFLGSRENTMMMVGGALGALAFVLPAVGMVLLHFRNDEPGRAYPPHLFFVLYPVGLLAAGLVAVLA